MSGETLRNSAVSSPCALSVGDSKLCLAVVALRWDSVHWPLAKPCPVSTMTSTRATCHSLMWLVYTSMYRKTFPIVDDGGGEVSELHSTCKWLNACHLQHLCRTLRFNAPKLRRWHEVVAYLTYKADYITHFYATFMYNSNQKDALSCLPLVLLPLHEVSHNRLFSYTVYISTTSHIRSTSLSQHTFYRHKGNTKLIR